MVTNQKIHKKVDTPYGLAMKYLGIIFLLNDVKITTRELSVLSWIATEGTISSPPKRKACLQFFNISNSSLNNTVSQLQQRNILVKEKSKTRIAQALRLDFPNLKSINLNINLNLPLVGTQ